MCLKLMNGIRINAAPPLRYIRPEKANNKMNDTTQYMDTEHANDKRALLMLHHSMY